MSDAVLRIAMVGHKGIPALHGGIERHVDEIASRLAARGHAVDVFNRPYHPFAATTHHGVRILRRPSLPTKHLDAASHTALCVLETITSGRYDLLHVHGIGPGLFVGLGAPFLPTVFTYHAQDWRQEKWGPLARRALLLGERVAVRRAQAVITVSRGLQDYVRRAYGRDAAYVPNGAWPHPVAPVEPLREWSLAPDGYVLFVGRLIRDRGIGDLLAAWKNIDSSRRLVITGDVQHDDAYAAALRQQADARVVFTGYQTGEALAALYAHAAVCVHPSEVEGLPIAVLEAMSHGRTVLVSDIPENLEAVGSAGAVFRVRDVAALGAALGRLLDDPEERRRLGQRARARVQSEYDWDAITSATEAIYRRVAGGRGRRGRLEPGRP